MPNYFTENEDLLFHFKRLDLEEAVQILEDDYNFGKQFPGAPKNFQEAFQNYQGSLELAGDLAANFIAPRADKVDMKGAILKDGKVTYASETLESYKQLAQAGLTGVILPHDYGGINFPATIYMMLIEIVSRADASLMTLFGYQDVGEAISKFGSEEIRKRFLPPYISGEHIGSMVMTEPGAGSDLQSIQLKAYQDEQGQWRLNGVKHFISNGCGDMLLVLARSESGTKNMFGLSLFVCPGGEKVQVTHIEEKMGLHGSPTCQLYFDDAPCYLVGKRRQGLLHVLYVLNHARFSVAAQALGIAEAAYQEALSFAKIREQFGKLIYDMPPVANMLVDIRVAIESCRSLLYAGAQWLDLRNNLEEKVEKLKKEGRDSEMDRNRFQQAAKITDLLSPLAKYIISETAIKVCYDAQQLHGGMGYMREMTVERLARDVRITTIYEGTSQIHIGACYKSVVNDVLGDFFDENENKQYDGELEGLAKKMKEMRGLFADLKQLIQDNEDASFREAAAKELVDVYSYIYRGYLLMQEAQENERKIHIARRFIAQSLAATHKSLQAVKNEQFNDIAFTGIICK
ncbi:acyl-CoA dehydrogenase family protein [Fulvivirgaceae bacterium BMA12]|uniref:Acyl-CoA dehydrogenase family protein n=1 Tax=Agaribacillus aureus TaxID=3051825 RepID=A0ABT8LBE8_9BACT|nr:acyl-CoA dehydrogenase family protein [Fulvivirgaceae bacterium BMA12]